MFDCAVQFCPSTFQLIQERSPGLCQTIIFSRRTLRRFFPFLIKQTGIFQACQQRIKRTFDHNKTRFFQRLYNIRHIRPLFTKNQECTILKNPLAHLRFYIFRIHTLHLYATNIAQKYKYLAIQGTDFNLI